MSYPRPDRKMLEMLVCPLTGETLHFDAASQELISKKARLAFPIYHGVPIMIISQARPLTENEYIEMPKRAHNLS